VRKILKEDPTRSMYQGMKRMREREASVAVMYSFPLASPLANRLNGATIESAIMRAAARRFASKTE